ncbi:hypothetical protein C6380_19065 [Pseudomonas syringae pv. actinidiae]|uniref:hypothetical protein n=1 Tax=Pseudomonas syringae TaxID=317 RepID=UPI000BB5893B|nr:hypothetical protein [Pseudomonas syringae]PBK47983.1 hypothetical protein BUE61_27355 [Pseudomonas syringae pv. actinidiae]PBK49313.1 hypothetical protein BUE60_24495 [Pseudomonas syringae pv. actinidiae]RJX53378.1 hypothetical protein C6380_19065 [Pseudomonas syringae pv. actinidiae]RJX57441.1 hypothetical protein C6383_19930 [Pseudomonas syringae pv. actinidiae]RJX63644.1 hypothetical protein C6379_00085 [Pseudomonas syringae pv. actinidiae]
MKPPVHLLGTLVGLWLSSAADASVTLYPASLKVLPAPSSKNQFKIYSKSDSVQYLNVYVTHVINPATAEEKELPVSISNKQHLSASPQTIVLPPGGEQTIHLQMTSPPRQETVYRVFVESRARDEKVPVDKTSDTTRSTGLRWSVLAYCPPLHPVSDIRLNLKSRLIENAGNIHAWIKDISVCSDHSEESCTKATIATTLPPESRLSIPLNGSPVNHVVVNYQTKDSAVHSRRWDF